MIRLPDPTVLGLRRALPRATAGRIAATLLIAVASSTAFVTPAFADHEGNRGNDRGYYDRGYENDRGYDRGQERNRYYERRYEQHRYRTYAPEPVYRSWHRSPGISLFVPLEFR
jgi:hypothetical protein